MDDPKNAVPKLLATSGLHVAYEQNRRILDRIHPSSEHDWLLLAGDVGEVVADIERTLRLLSERFAKVVWVPGNHELWTPRHDPVQLTGEQRYRHLVEICRGLGVITPEDPYPVWADPEGAVHIVPLFIGYDYSFMPPGAENKEDALKIAYDKGVVCTDEFLLHPDPYPSRQAWCDARITETERRLTALGDGLPTVLVTHYPLVRAPTDVLYPPELAQWCGTRRTSDWHRRFRATAVVYGHLHIPRTTHHAGVPFEEVSLGYPREWTRHGLLRGPVRRILPRREAA